MSAGTSTAIHPHPDDWQPILELAVQEVFEIMLGCGLQPAPSEIVEGHGEFTAMVGLAGALVGVMTFSCSAETASRIAIRMLGPEVVTTDRQAWDGLGEICNMIAGNFKNKLTGLDGRCLLSVPSIVIGAAYRFHSLTEGRSLKSILLFEDMPVTVNLELQN
jgi:chemotaxis protein CheX